MVTASTTDIEFWMGGAFGFLLGAILFGLAILIALWRTKGR